MSYLLEIPIEILTLVASNLSPEDLFSLLQSNISLASWLISSAFHLRYTSSPHSHPAVKETSSDLSTTSLCCDNRTLLHHAVESVEKASSSAATIKHLFSYTTTLSLLNVADSHGLTPLHLAARFSAAVCSVLLEAGAEINVQNSIGETPLFIAVEAGRADVVKCLLDHQADMTIKSDDYTALQKAVMFGKEDVVACLQEKVDEQSGTYGKREEYRGFRKGHQVYASLNNATSTGFLKAVSAMLKSGINPFAPKENEQDPPTVAVIACWRNMGTVGTEMMMVMESDVEEGTRADGNGSQKNGRKRAREETWEQEPGKRVKTGKKLQGKTTGAHKGGRSKKRRT